MDLKTFVKQALLDINSAIEEADNESNREMHLASPHDNKCVMFDIAVTAETITNSAVEGKTEGIIKVVAADISGRMNEAIKNEVVSRVSFGIYVASSTKKIVEKEREELRNMNK